MKITLIHSLCIALLICIPASGGKEGQVESYCPPIYRPPPDLKVGVQKAHRIIIGTYLKYKDRKEPITFYYPPEAVFKVSKVLKGKKWDRNTIGIRYEFHDMVNGPKPKGWKFSKALMPKKGSKWILVIPYSYPIVGMYETYHGKYGRLPLTKDNLERIKSFL